MDNGFALSKKLNNGINISFLEVQNNGKVQASGSRLAHKIHESIRLGFSSVRLPIALDDFCDPENGLPAAPLFHMLDKAVKICSKNKVPLILCYHRGHLSNENYLDEKARLTRVWETIAQHFAATPANLLLFEPYNEPLTDEWRWKEVFTAIAAGVRKWNPDRILLFGSTNYSSIYEFSRMQPLNLNGIIYSFHFYEPFLFTHQGAAWAGNQCATTGFPYPWQKDKMPAMNPKVKNTWGEHNYYTYEKEANDTALFHKLKLAHNWSMQYGLPILCGEFGSYGKFADGESRCRYTAATVKALNYYQIPYMYWDFDREFGIKTGKKIIPCFYEIFNLKKP